MLRLRLAACGLVLALALDSTQLASAPPPARATLANPAVRLWYEETGRLSQNIVQIRDFNLWNSIIGEGSAEENANDALFTVEVRTNGQQNVDGPLTLSAQDSNGKVLASRTIRSLLTSDVGRMNAALWVRDVGCAGAVTFSASLGASRQRAVLNFNCGE